MPQRRRRDLWDVLIVGGGIAGLTAACNAARRGFSTALYEAGIGCGGQVANVNALDDWPAVTPSSGVALTASLVDEACRLRVEIVYQPVRSLKTLGNLVLVDAGERTLRARRVIAASGAQLSVLGVPGEKALRGKGVSQCAHCDGHFFRGNDVVVAGGGDAALQEALVLAAHCSSVTIVVRSSLCAKRAYIDQAANTANVKFLWDSIVVAVLGSSAVTGVRLRDVKSGAETQIPCTGLFPFIGTKANTDYLPPQVARDEFGRAITDAAFRTGASSVFAVGAVRSDFSGELVSAAGEAVSAVATIARELATQSKKPAAAQA